MKTITEQFLAGIRWNTIEAILYQGILWGYHFALFSTLDRSLYGTVGILFSLLFMGSTLFTLGLDTALSPFIRHYTESKGSFIRLMTLQCSPNIVIYGILLLLVSAYDFNLFFGFFGIPHLEKPFILVLILLLILESIKKIIKTFLGLLFYNQSLASLEIIYILLYVITIISLRHAGLSITLYTLFIPMLFYSILATTLLTVWLYRKYQTLPDTLYIRHAGLGKRILQSRYYGYINQLGHLIFSGNMLVAVFATQTGTTHTAVVKIVSTSIQAISNVISRVIGQPSEAAFAHAHAYAKEEKQSLFTLANRYTQTSIIALCIMTSLFNYQVITTHVMASTLHTYALLIVFGVLLLIEPFFITYEKKYLIEEQGHYLLYYHTTMMLLFGIWVYCKCAFPLLCLISFAIIRLTSYRALGMHLSIPRFISRT